MRDYIFFRLCLYHAFHDSGDKRDCEQYAKKKLTSRVSFFAIIAAINT